MIYWFPYIKDGVTLVSLFALSIMIVTICGYHEYKRRTVLHLEHLKKQLELTRLENERILQSRRQEELQVAIIYPPEVQRMRDLLAEFTANETKWDCIIAMGDIYRNGAFPRFLPNEDVGIQCFQIAAQCPDGNVAGIAQMKFIQARTDPIGAEDKAGEQFPAEYGLRICEVARQRIHSTPWLQFERPKQQGEPRNQPRNRDQMTQRERRVAPEPPVDRLEAPFIRVENENDDDVAVEEVRLAPNPAYRSDAQNVHDHSVLSTIKYNLNKIQTDLEKAKVKRGSGNVKEEIRRALLQNTEMKDTDVSNALKVLDSLNNNIHSSFGISENAILETVWRKIQLEKNATVRANMTETLGKQLATGIELGTGVCSTGKITRIMSIFEGSDEPDMQVAKPLWAVKEEIATTAANIRKKYVDVLDDADKVRYEKGLMPELDDQMKREFRETTTSLYCDTLGMQKDIIGPVIEMYEEAF